MIVVLELYQKGSCQDRCPRTLSKRFMSGLLSSPGMSGQSSAREPLPTKPPTEIKL
jgi:hypothetical protein